MASFVKLQPPKNTGMVVLACGVQVLPSLRVYSLGFGEQTGTALLLSVNTKHQRAGSSVRRLCEATRPLDLQLWFLPVLKLVRLGPQ